MSTYCRITGKSRGLPKPNYFPLLPPISPADAKRFCRITGKAYGLPSHHYIPVLVGRPKKSSRVAHCAVTQKSEGQATHSFPHGKRHVILSDFRYVFPSLDDSPEMIRLLAQKNIESQDKYIYTVEERRCSLVFPAKLEAAVREGDVRDVMLSKDSDTLLLKLRRGGDISIDVKDIDVTGLSLWEGEGPSEEVLKKRAKRKRTGSTDLVRKIFEDKEKAADIAEYEESEIKKARVKNVKLTSGKIIEPKKQKWDNFNEESVPQLTDSVVNAISITTLEKSDWSQIGTDNSILSGELLANRLPDPISLPPENVNLELSSPGIVQQPLSVSENLVGFKPVAAITPISPLVAEPDPILQQCIRDQLNTPERLCRTANVDKLFTKSDSSLSILPRIDEIPEMMNHFHEGVPAVEEKNGVKVHGLKIDIEAAQRFVVGQSIDTPQGPVFIPGQTVQTPIGEIFLPGITVSTPEGARLLPGQRLSIKDETGNNKNVFVAGQSVMTREGEKFIQGQSIITSEGIKFVPGQTVITGDSPRFVPGQILISEKPDATQFIPGQTELTPNGPKFVPGQTVELANGKLEFIAGQSAHSENGWNFVPGKSVTNGEGELQFLPGREVVTEEGKLFVPGQYVNDASGKPQFVAGVTIKNDGVDAQFIPGMTMETPEGNQFVVGQILKINNGNLKFVPGKSIVDSNGTVNFAAAQNINEVVFNKNLSIGLLMNEQFVHTDEKISAIYGHMVQTEKGVEFFPGVASGLPAGKVVPGKLIRGEEVRFIPGIVIDGNFVPGQMVMTDQGKQFVPGQVIETENGAKFVPGQVIDSGTGPKFVPGQTINTEDGPKFVPGQIVETKAGPTFIPGQIISTDEEGSRFVPGQVVDTIEGPRFVPGRVIETGDHVTFVPGQVVQTSEGLRFIAPDLQNSEEGECEFTVQSFQVTPEELNLLQLHAGAVTSVTTGQMAIDSRMMRQLSQAGMAVGRQVPAEVPVVDIRTIPAMSAACEVSERLKLDPVSTIKLGQVLACVGQFNCDLTVINSINCTGEEIIFIKELMSAVINSDDDTEMYKALSEIVESKLLNSESGTFIQILDKIHNFIVSSPELDNIRKPSTLQILRDILRNGTKENKSVAVEKLNCILKNNDETVTTAFRHLSEGRPELVETVVQKLYENLSNIESEKEAVETLQRAIVNTVRESSEISVQELFHNLESTGLKNLIVQAVGLARALGLLDVASALLQILSDPESTKVLSYDSTTLTILRRLTVMRQLAEKRPSFVSALGQLQSDPELARTDPLLRELVRESAALMVVPEEAPLLESSADIPSALFHQPHSLAMEDYLIQTRKHGILLIIKDGLQMVVPREASRLVLTGKVPYKVLDEKGIHHFAPMHVFSALRLPNPIQHNFSMYACKVEHDETDGTLTPASSVSLEDLRRPSYQQLTSFPLTNGQTTLDSKEYNEDRDLYVAKHDYVPEDENSLALRKGDKVILLKTEQHSLSSASTKKPKLDPDLDLGETDHGLSLLDNSAAKHKMSVRPKRNHVDSRQHRNEAAETSDERWFVQTIGEPLQQGWVPSSALTLHDDSPEGPSDARFKREAVIRELVETEEEFGRDLQQVVDHYLKPIDNKSVPSIIRDNKDLIFGNLKQIAELHNSVLIEGVKYYANEPRMLGKTFIRLERDFDKHVAYCRDEPAAQDFLQENDAVRDYFEEVSQRLGDDKSLSEHLKLPIQRINDYQLLLKELVKYSNLLGEDTTDLGKALELMLAVPHRANDNKFISNIEGFHGNIHKLGRLLRHDWFSVTDREGKSKDRYLFLFKARILVCKVRRISEDRFVFLLKDIIRLPEVEVKDLKDSDRAFELHHKLPGFANYPLTISAHRDRVKNSWLAEIREYASDVLALAEHAADDLRLHAQPDDKKDFEPLTGIQLEPATPGQELPIERPSDEQNLLPELLSKRGRLKEVPRKVETSLGKVLDEVPVDSSVKRKEGEETKELPVEKKIKTEQEESLVVEDVFKSKVLEQSEVSTDSSVSIKRKEEGKNIESPAEKKVKTDQEVSKVTKEVSSTSAVVEKSKEEAQVSSESIKRKEEESKDSPSEKKIKTEVEETEETDMDRFSGSRRSVASRRVEEFRSVSSTSSQEVYVETSSARHQMSSSSSSARSMKMVEESAALNGRTISHFREVSGDVDGFSSIQEIAAGTRAGDSYTTIEEVSSGTRGSVDYTSAKRDSQDLTSKAILGEELSSKTSSVAAKDTKSLSSSKSSSSKQLFSKTIGGNSLNLGDRAVFECAVDENVKVIWLKDNKPLSIEGQSDRFTIISSDSSHRLEIFDVKDADAGIYTARAFNAATNTSSSCTAQLAIDKKECEGDKMKLDAYPPFFIVHLKDTELLENTFLRFMIKVKGSPNPDLKFYKDDRLITSVHPRVTIVRENAEKGFYELVINNVEAEDAGKYKCIARNEHGEVECEANVSVVDEKKLFEGLEESELLAPGETPHFMWLRDGQPFDPEERFKVLFKDEEDSLALVFQHVKPEDAGLYTCVASTSTGKISCSAELTVQGSVNHLMKEPMKPKIVTEVKRQEASVGGSAMLELKIEGYPKPQIQWTKGEQEIKADAKHKLLYEDDESMSLVIKNVTADDAGEYKVKAVNDLGEDADVIHLTVKAPPKFKRKLSDSESMAGQDIRLSVEVEGSPKPNIQWYKDGLLIKKSDRVKLFEEASTEFTLLIESSDLEDAGSYSVVATNELSQCSDFCQVQVRTPPKFIKGMTKSMETKEGDNIQFQVKVQGDPKPAVKWLHGDKELKPDGKHIKITEDGPIHTLTVSGIGRNDAGKYTCELSNEHGKSTDSGDLNVLCSPQFRTKLTDTKANEGDTNVEFTVNVDAFPKPSIQWFHDEVEITEKVTEFTRVEEGDNYKLIIKEVTKELSGKYTCKVVNDLGENTTSSTFTVYSKPKFKKGLKDVQVDEGDSLTLQVEVEGVPDPTVKWYKNGQEVSGDAHIKISRDSKRIENYSLTFTLVKPEDGGEYEVRASNEMGTTISQSTITVHTKTSHMEDSELVEEVEKVPKKEKAEKVDAVDESPKKTDESEISDKPKKGEDSKGLKPSRKITVEDVNDEEQDIFASDDSKIQPGSFTCVEVNIEESEISINNLPNSNGGIIEEYSDSEDKQHTQRLSVSRGISINSVSEEESKQTLTPDDEPLTPKEAYIFENDVSNLESKEKHGTISDGNKLLGDKKGKKFSIEEQEKLENVLPEALENDSDKNKSRKGSKIDVSLKEEGTVLSNDMNGDITDNDDIRRGSKAELHEMKRNDSSKTPDYGEMNGHDGGVTRKGSKAALTDKEDVEGSKEKSGSITDLPSEMNVRKAYIIDVIDKTEWNAVNGDADSANDKDSDGKDSSSALKADLVNKGDIIQNGPQTLDTGSRKNSKQNLAEFSNDSGKSKQNIDDVCLANGKQSGLFDKESALVNGNNDENELKQSVDDVSPLSRKQSVKYDKASAMSVNDADDKSKRKQSVDDFSPKSKQQSEKFSKESASLVNGDDGDIKQQEMEDSVSPSSKKQSVNYSKESATSVNDADDKSKRKQSVDNVSSSNRKQSVKYDKESAVLVNGDDGRRESVVRKASLMNGDLLQKGKRSMSINDDDDVELDPEVADLLKRVHKQRSVLEEILRDKDGSNKGVAEAFPQILSSDMESKSVFESLPTHFEVNAIANPRPDVKWFKDGNQIVPSDHIKLIEEDGDKYKLLIDNVKKDDAGDYKCVVSNRLGEKAQEAKLSVTPVTELRGPKVKTPLTDTKIPKTESGEMTAVFTADPEPEVKWTHNSNDVDASFILKKDIKQIEGGLLECSYTLQIPSGKHEDTGVYKIEATNKYGCDESSARLDIILRPEILVFKDVAVAPPEDTELIAVIIANPKPKLSWSFDGNPIKDDNRHKLLDDQEKEIYKMQLKSATKDDDGIYKVTASNSEGKTSAEARLSVHTEAPSFVKKLEDQIIREYALAEFKVRANGVPKPKITWYKDGKELISGEDGITIETVFEGQVSSTLTIEHFTKDHAGSYTVKAVNMAGEAECSGKFKLAQVPPGFLKPLDRSTDVCETEPLELKAKIEGSPLPQVKWFKDGQELPGDDRIKLTATPDGNVKLTIDSVNPGDSGQYKLVVSNPNGETTSVCAVAVTPTPKKPSITKGLSDTKGVEGEPLRIEAQIEGYPEPNVKWLKDGHPIRPSQSLSFVKTPSGQVGIEIDCAKPEDAGSYSLTISNKLGEASSKAQVDVSKKDKKPQFLIHLMPTNVVEGFPARMEVKVTGHPTPQLTWTRNGKPVEADGQRIKIVPGPDGTECLFIDKATLDDAGEFTVTARNSQGEVISKAPLTVTCKARNDQPEEKPAFIKDLRDTYTDEGEPLVFSAPIIGNPIPDVEWEKDGKKLEPDDRIRITCDGNKVGLEINPSKLSDAGTYKCKLSNPLGEAESSAKGNVKKVYQPPQFTQRFTDQQQIPSYDAKFLARISGIPKPEVSWYKDGIPILDNDKYKIKQDGDTYCLYIKDVEPNDAGRYKCLAKNREGEATCEAQLQVVDKIEKSQRMEPPSFLKKIGDCEVFKGMTAKFTACATGYPEPEVEWYRGDDKLYPSERIRMEKEGIGLLRLSIIGVDPDVDIGKYRCRIFNPYGEDSCEANIVYDSLDFRPRKPISDQYTDIEKYKGGAPLPLADPPIISRMTDRKLTLSWKPSIPHGPREPVTYLVEMCEQPDGEWFTARRGLRSCVCDISNLEPFRDYKFRIRVENKYGTSDPSPFALTHRARLIPEPPKFTPHLPPGTEFDPHSSPYFPKDFDIDRPPHDKYAQAPRFLRQEHDTQYGVKGHNCNLFWFVYGYPKPKMEYFFNDEPIEMGGRYDSSYTRNGQATLFINKMLDRDVGVYEAVATNEYGQARQRVRLEIAEYPQFLQRPEETTIMMRKSGRLIARVIGVPYPDIKWFKDWQPLATSSRLKIKFVEPDTCILTINDAMTRDEGLYSITASNIAGTISSSVSIKIEDNEAEYSYMNYDKGRNVKARTKPIEDKYDLGDELGRGTQGITYHAVERSTGRNFAGKVMHGKGSLRPLMRNELDIMNQLNHRKLIRLYDAYEDQSRLTLIMELAGGGELLDNLTKQTFTTESEISSYIRQVLWGLEHMHDQNIAHLGLTPGDLLISHAGSDDLKICDFGLSRRIPFGKHASLEYGMPEYVSPEIVKGDGVGTSADMWALGVITHVLLTGISPFKGNNDMETLNNVKETKWSFQEDIWRNFSKEARDFITRLLVAIPEGRMDVKEALRHPWLNLADRAPPNEYNITTDSLRNYYNSLRDWYGNASCRKWYRRQPLEGAYTHPSRMVYPPGAIYTPESTPDRYFKDKDLKEPRTWEDQIPSREPIDYELGVPKNESHYQNGPDTYLLQLRDVDFPVRLREYMKVAANRAPTGLGFTRESLDQQPHIDWRAPVIRERRRFTDVMDEEIDDERKARINKYGSADTYSLRRLRNEIGTRLDAHVEAEAIIESKKDGHAPFFREKPQITAIREEQPAEFACLAVGEPKPVIQWFKNDMVVGESNRIKILEDEHGRSVLKLNPALSIDAGIYKVVARNKVGQTVARTRLIIASVPSAPDSPEASEVSDTEILLRWKLPRDDGNSPILCYNLQYKEAESTEWTDVASNIDHEFWVVRNLSPNTGHQFRLAARNNLGWSAKGIPTEIIKTKESGAPKISVTSAMKLYQTVCENGKEIKPEETSFGNLDYSAESNPIQWNDSEQPIEKYNFISEIHRGQFSVVVKGVNKSTEEVVVGKLLELRPDTEEEVNREFENLRTLRHERIASLIEAFKPSGSTVAMLIEEKLQGADVLTYLSTRHEYTEQMVATVATQVLDALHYLHWRGYCHLNIQPDNIVMSSVRSVQVKLVDLGSAQRVNKLGTVVRKTGSLEFSAPEVLHDEPAFPQSDIWSLGVVTYILLSGASPFLGLNNAETRQNINFVRYRFEHLYKELTQEATRFLMLIFKRSPSKRPTAEECHEHRWLLPTEYMIKRRERAIFLGNRLKEFSDKYHSKISEESTHWDPLSNTDVGRNPLARSNSIQEELLINF